jgi:hypothetical protein
MRTTMTMMWVTTPAASWIPWPRRSSPRGHPSQSRSSRRRLNHCAANRRTPTLGEQRQQVEEKSPRGRRGQAILRG